MTEMIERVALAIAAASGDRFEVMAKAAIEAMREPTEAMEFAGCTGHQEFGMSDARRCWDFMIDAALSSDNRDPE